MRSTVAIAAGISLAVGLGISGCGEAQKLTAKQQVSDSVSGLEAAHSVAFTATLQTTTADIAAISKAEGEPMTASDRKTFAQLLKGDVVYDLQAPAGQTFGQFARTEKKTAATQSGQSLTQLLDDPAALAKALKNEPSLSVATHLSGSSLFEFRLVNGVVYVRADVKKLLSLSGQSPAELNQTLNALPPSMAALGDAAKGKWVSVDLLKTSQALKSSGLLKALPQTPVATPTVSVAATQKLIADLKTAFSQKASIASLGSSARGTGYQLSAPAKQVALSVQSDLVALAGAKAGPEIEKEIGQIPNKTFSVDVWVKNSQLSDISLDLTQFLKKPAPGRKLAVNIAIAVNHGSVSAPAGATALNVKSMLSQIPGGLSGLSGLTPGSSDSSSGSGTAVPLGGTGLTKAQIKQLKQSGLTDAQIKEIAAHANPKA